MIKKYSIFSGRLDNSISVKDKFVASAEGKGDMFVCCGIHHARRAARQKLFLEPLSHLPAKGRIVQHYS